MGKKVLAVVLVSVLLFSAVVMLHVNSSALYLVSASPSAGWSRTYGGADWDQVESVIQTHDGGYALAGNTKSFGSGGYEFWLIKTDSLGNIEWNKTYGSGSAFSIVQTSDEGYIIAGGAKLVKTDSTGNIQWNRTYEGEIRSTVQTSDGGYALAGTTAFVVFSSADFWVAKTDALGNLQWEKTFGGPTMDAGESVIQTSDGGYALLGTTTPGAGEGDFLLVKTDSEGNIQWDKTYGSQDKDEGHAVVQTSDGGYVLAGLIWNRSGGDAGLIKTDSVGNIQWKRSYDGGTARSMAMTSDGGFIIACSNLVKTDSEGKIQWSQPYGEAYSVIQTSDGGYALAGRSIIVVNDELSDIDAFLIKTDPEGIIPEFPSWIILPLLMTATLAVIIYKKRLLKVSSS